MMEMNGEQYATLLAQIACINGHYCSFDQIFHRPFVLWYSLLRTVLLVQLETSDVQSDD